MNGINDLMAKRVTNNGDLLAKHGINKWLFIGKTNSRSVNLPN